MKTYIYILTDEYDCPRYVGKSNDPQKRLRCHIREAKKGIKKSHRNNWINSMLNDGYSPNIKIIAEVEIQEWQYWEIYWIEKYKESGAKLTNSTIGGDGNTVYTEEVRKKMSVSRKKYNHPKEVYEKIANSNRGSKRTEETCANISKGNKGKTKIRTKETNEKISKAMTGKKHSQEHIDNRAKAGYGIKRVFCFTNNKEYASAKEAAIDLNLHKSAIHMVCRGELKQTGGFKFKFI